MREKYVYVVEPGPSYTIVRGLFLAASVIGGSVALAIPIPLGVRLPTVVLTAALSILFLRSFFNGYIVLGIAQNGVVVGGDALLHPKGRLDIPWGEVEAIILWRRQDSPVKRWKKTFGHAVVTVGLEVKADAASKYSNNLRFRDLSQRDARVANFCGLVIPTGGTDFYSSRLLEAIKLNAPEVQIIDATKGSL